MMVIQIVPSLTYGDAVGNDVLAIDALLKRMGIHTIIYTGNIGKRIPQNIARRIEEWEIPKKEDIIIYHIATIFEHIHFLIDAKCRKIGIYHNITPPHFYADYNPSAYDACRRALRQVKDISNVFDYCLADSEFNRQSLISYGYQCRIDVLPILIPYDDYKRIPDETVLKRFGKETTNVLFVGRFAPNKKYEDVIASFYAYQKRYDHNARLFLVGSFDHNDLYCKRLLEYIDMLHVENVYIPGHIRFEEVLAYYSIADVFLCLSEHEGFCVPLIEAMLFDVPIIAYDKCAVGETLGGSGFLLKTKDYCEIAAVIDRVILDHPLRDCMLRNQRERLSFFQTNKVCDMFKDYLSSFVRRDSFESVGDNS